MIGVLMIGIMTGAGAHQAAFAAEQAFLVIEQPLMKQREPGRLSLYVTNPSDRAVSFVVQDHLPVEIAVGTQRRGLTVPLAPAETAGERIIPPTGFLKVDYILTLPEDIRPGPVHLSLRKGQGRGVFVMLRSDKVAGHELAATGPSDKRTPETAEEVAEREFVVLNERDIEELKQEKGFFFENISRYEPSYILFGNDDFNAKFQLSFKYRLFGGGRQVSDRRSWLEGIHFSYTQTSFWDLAAESKPFEDNIFQPELFYFLEDWRPSFLPESANLDLQFGFRHESNGQGADKSRSLNVLYARPGIDFDLGAGRFFRLMADVWAYVGDLSDNPDIKDFRGHTGLSLTYGTLDGVQIASRIRGSLATGQGSVTLDATYPLNKLFFKNIDIYLQAQLFTGYGETLLDYNRKVTRLRFGVGIIR